MSRKKIEKKIITPDPIYNNILVAKFINHIMERGKKTIAQKIVYKAFELVKEKTKREPIEVFDLALKNVGPLLEVKSKRVGGAIYQVPVEVGETRRITLAMRWIINAAKSKKGKPMKIKLAEEFTDALNNIGAAVEKKKNTHRMAEANRTFAHFAR